MKVKKITLRTIGLLALCLLLASLSGALAGIAQLTPPPPGPPPTPPPPPPEPEPTPEMWPCAHITPLPPEIGDELLRLIPIPPPFEPDDGLLFYDGRYFKTFIRPEWQGVQAFLNFDQLQRGAFIGGMRALVRFQIIDRGQCFPTLAAARSYDDGSYLFWMANALILRIKDPPEMITAGIHLNWFMAVIKIGISPDGKVDIKDIAAIIFYPDARYHSPEEMLKAARSLDDGGILAPLPPETATD
jgi:hypothetical protein